MVPQGLDNTCFEQGLKSWRARQPEKVLDAAPEEATPGETNCNPEPV
jgi:hypothetical protein